MAYVEEGELVSAARSPRFNRQSVEEALEAIPDRIKTETLTRARRTQITDAVAFGDFLLDRSITRSSCRCWNPL
jgi:hypothetical protein